MKLLTKPILNSELTATKGQPVLMVEVLPVRPGDRMSLRILDTSGDWRQGVWLAVVGELEIAGRRGDQFEIWADSAPPVLPIKVVSTNDGLLRLYNIWDSGRGRRSESQSFMSGMLKDERNGRIVYRAHDFGPNPRFDKLVFELMTSPETNEA